MRNYKKDGTTALDAVCAVIFVLIIFTYYYSFQGDILGMTQYSWSEHQTHYDRLTGGIIFTVIVCCISAVSAFMFTLPERARTMCYMPAMVLSGVVTGATVDAAGQARLSWGLVGIGVLTLVAYPYIARKLQGLSGLYATRRDGSTSVTKWWSNILFLIALTVIMFCLGNTDRSLHTRLAVERLCREGNYEEALAYGIPKYDNDEALTMWRAYALAKNQKGIGTEMGERLFTYNITGSTTALLPKAGAEPHSLLRDNYIIWQAIGFVPRDINEAQSTYLARELKRGTARKASIDYLLCTYLVNKDLERFVKELVKYYGSTAAFRSAQVQAVLPQHYAEALLVYESGRNATVTAGLNSLKIDDAVRADYYDFMNVLRERKNVKEKDADLRDNYFGTYWYYFYKQ